MSSGLEWVGQKNVYVLTRRFLLAQARTCSVSIFNTHILPPPPPPPTHTHMYTTFACTERERERDDIDDDDDYDDDLKIKTYRHTCSVYTCVVRTLASACVCVCACVRACVRARVCVCVFMYCSNWCVYILLYVHRNGVCPSLFKCTTLIVTTASHRRNYFL